jgi:two-component system sensor histidine kinase AauS
LRLDVIDTGPGVPPALRAHIFEPFFRADNSRPGAGLGLAIARSLVRGRGGDIVLRPKRRQGAAFRVLLESVDEPA